MRVHCTQCGGLIPAEDLNIDTTLARCRACNNVFSFADAVAQETTAPAAPAADRVVPQPRGVRVEDWGGDVRLIRRWFSAKYIFLIFFCTFWDGFLVFWYTAAFSMPQTPWIMVVFPILHVAVGAGLTYTTACGLLNRTILTIGSGILTVQHGPLPWWGNRQLVATDLDQLYCRRRLTHNRGGTSETFELHATLKSGTSLKLLSGIEDAEQALFIEAEVERRLGIKDRRVVGAFRG